MHICVGKLIIIGSDNGLPPGRRQATIWTNAGILLIGPLGTNFSEILIEIQTFSFMKMHLEMSSVKWRPFCLGLNVLMFHFTMSYRPQRQQFHRGLNWSLKTPLRLTCPEQPQPCSRNNTMQWQWCPMDVQAHKKWHHWKLYWWVK